MPAPADAYFAGLAGWQLKRMTQLRRDILAGSAVTEIIKWGHPVYDAGGPLCLLKAHKAHIAFGFFQGAALVPLEPRLVPNGSFKMATIRLEEEAGIGSAQVRRLVSAAIALNSEHAKV